MTCAEIKKTMKEHGDYASAVMNLRADSITTPIVRYKNFINSNGIVKSIMGEIIEKSVTSPDLFLRDATSYEVDENKGSFFLGVLASIISGLVLWGITELIMYLLK